MHNYPSERQGLQYFMNNNDNYMSRASTNYDFDLSNVKTEPQESQPYVNTFATPTHYTSNGLIVPKYETDYAFSDVACAERYSQVRDNYSSNYGPCYDFNRNYNFSPLENISNTTPIHGYGHYPQAPTMTEVMQQTTPEGKRKRQSKKSQRTSAAAPYTTVPLPPCKVCSGVATGFHFGVITCEACKAFFRRALIHKQAYKCLKDDDCQIIDKKLGNCSACRLKKCFALGMSKGGVRRGRYSIAIRTQAIVEAKAMEGKDAAAMVPKHQHKRPKIEQPSSTDAYALSPDSGISLDAFDGLLEISELDENFDLTVTMHSSALLMNPLSPPAPLSPATPKFEPNMELELLIDALMSVQEAVYPNLRKQMLTIVHDKINREYESLKVKDEALDNLFGKSDAISTEEYQQIFAETGIDLDDRLAHFNQKGMKMESEIAQYVNYAKIIPGFKNLNPKDVSRLLKASHLEFWVFGNYQLMNNKLKVCLNEDGSYQCRKSEMSKFFDSEWIDKCMAYVETLQKLDLSPEEIAIIRVIILTYTDRCSLIDRPTIQNLQEKFVECLRYQLSRTVTNPGERLYKIFDRLLAIRDLTELNIKVNRKFLLEWGFVMHDYPLWKEMLSFDEL